MAIRQTSIDCYNQIKADGLLSKMRMKIYEAIYFDSPCTSSEVFKSLNLKTNQSGRFTELRELGVIYEKGIRSCNVTGRNAIAWDLTDNLPIDKQKVLTPKEKIKELKLMICKLEEQTSDMFIRVELEGIRDFIKTNFNI